MTSPTLRAALEALRRDREQATSALSADAERAIRRRVGTRTGLRGGAFLAVGGLALATAAGAWGARTDDVVPSPSPTPTATIEPGVASATFPLSGGPEFEPLYRSIGCGDPAPATHPSERDFTLTLERDARGTYDIEDDPMGAYIDVKSTLAYESEADAGVAATTGVMLLAVKDGMVVGVRPQGAELDVALDRKSARESPDTITGAWFGCEDSLYLPQQGEHLAPGTYDIVAVTRVFETPESVALSQRLKYSTSMAVDGSFEDWGIGGLYLPGSYDCKQGAAGAAPFIPRACLADFTSQASVDVAAGTATLLYDPAGLVEEFSILLVSEPITVQFSTLPPIDDGASWATMFPGLVESIGTLDGLTCGASASDVRIPNDQGVMFEATIDGPLDEVLTSGGAMAGAISSRSLPDGARVTLLPRARLVTFSWANFEVSADADTNSADIASGSGVLYATSVLTVTGSASVTASQAVTMDAYEGPQPVTFTIDPLTKCDIEPTDAAAGTDMMIAGTWLVELPDGTAYTVDAASRVGMLGDIVYTHLVG